MNLALILSGAMLGMASGGHCIAMCGAGSSYCLGTSTPATARSIAARLASFHAGRILAYALVGALLGGAAAAFHVLTEWVSLLRPLWTMANTAMFLFGMTLLVTARQPALVSHIGKNVGQWLRRGEAGRGKAVVMHTRETAFENLALAGAPAGQAVAVRGVTLQRRALLAGLGWAFIPCGPLYSAWTLALFAGDPLSGALTAAAFASASGAQLVCAQWLFGKRGQRIGQGGRWDKVGMRVAGAALSASAAYSIFMLLSGGSGMALFCL